MRLERVEIDNYRSIRHLSIDLDEVTTVIGEHDCGKSSLLSAIATVLDPDLGERAPDFTRGDYHRPLAPRSDRTAVLAITLSFGGGERPPSDGGSDDADDVLTSGPLVVRVRGERIGDESATSVSVEHADGEPIDAATVPSTLAALRRRHPAIVIRSPSVTARSVRVRDGDPSSGTGALVHRFFRRMVESDANASSRDEFEEMRSEVLDVAGAIADQLAPAPSRRRSIDDLTDSPRPLGTDLGRALEPDAGRQRHVAAMWLLAAVVDALPPGGVGSDADPILLFDDIESGVHPTWLAALAAVSVNLPLQEVIATHSAEMLTWMPLQSLRRLARSERGAAAHRVHRRHFSTDELRRVTYHLRLNRGASVFSRCWVLVEGETEAWLIPEFARLAGVEFPVEGIRSIEYSQSGVSPLIKLADDLGIAWMLLSDGDPAGEEYARSARALLGDGDPARVVELPAPDIEHYLFRNGYARTIAGAAGRPLKGTAGRLIRAAIKRTSKPALALTVLAAADRRGGKGVPPILRDVAETARDLARAQA